MAVWKGNISQGTKTHHSYLPRIQVMGWSSKNPIDWSALSPSVRLNCMCQDGHPNFHKEILIVSWRIYIYIHIKSYKPLQNWVDDHHYHRKQHIWVSFDPSKPIPPDSPTHHQPQHVDNAPGVRFASGVSMFFVFAKKSKSRKSSRYWNGRIVRS